MKILIFGMGSIGQRHVRILQSLSRKDIEIGAFRSRKFNWVISDKLGADLDKDPCEHYEIKCFYDIEEAFAWNPDIAFITNPISMHIETAILAAQNNCHIFIEKPLGSSLEEAQELLAITKEKKLCCMVGYQTRFHPAYIRIKNLLENNTLGSLTHASLHFGEWLPGMHPYEDYRISHAAKKNQGGGVILCLSHEVDLAYWLFGKPSSVYASGGHLSSELELDGVEDTANLILNCSSLKGDFPVNIHLDFLQKPPTRKILIIGSKGKVEFNYHTNEMALSILPEGNEEITSYSDFQRNDMFKSEVEQFIESIELDKKVPIPLEEGIEAMRVCLSGKKSLESKRVEFLND